MSQGRRGFEASRTSRRQEPHERHGVFAIHFGGWGGRRWLRTPKPQRPRLCLSVGFEGQRGRSPHREVGQPSAPMSEFVESRASFGSLGTKRRSSWDQTCWGLPSRPCVVFCARSRPVEGLSGPSRRALEPSGWERMSPVSFGGSEAGSRLRGEKVSLWRGTSVEDRPCGWGDSVVRERTRRGIEASKGAEPAVRAITVFWTQGDREVSGDTGEKGAHSRRGNLAGVRWKALGARWWRETGGDKV